MFYTILYIAAWVVLLGVLAWYHRPSPCTRHRLYARAHGIRWDGHCWDENEEGLFCMDCGVRG